MSISRNWQVSMVQYRRRFRPCFIILFIQMYSWLQNILSVRPHEHDSIIWCGCKTFCWNKELRTKLWISKHWNIYIFIAYFKIIVLLSYYFKCVILSLHRSFFEILGNKLHFQELYCIMAYEEYSFKQKMCNKVRP